MQRLFDSSCSCKWSFSTFLLPLRASVTVQIRVSCNCTLILLYLSPCLCSCPSVTSHVFLHAPVPISIPVHASSPLSLSFFLSLSLSIPILLCFVRGISPSSSLCPSQFCSQCYPCVCVGPSAWLCFVWQMLRPIRPGNWLSVALASANTSAAAAAASASGTRARVLDASWLARPFVGCEERPRMKRVGKEWRKERRRGTGKGRGRSWMELLLCRYCMEEVVKREWGITG